MTIAKIVKSYVCASCLCSIFNFFCDLQEEASLPNLLVVCGDHGMSETGSHGGSSAGEVHTPLLFISSAFEKRSGKDQKIFDLF